MCDRGAFYEAHVLNTWGLNYEITSKFCANTELRWFIIKKKTRGCLRTKRTQAGSRCCWVFANTYTRYTHNMMRCVALRLVIYFYGARCDKAATHFLIHKRRDGSEACALQKKNKSITDFLRISKTLSHFLNERIFKKTKYWHNFYTQESWQKALMVGKL